MSKLDELDKVNGVFKKHSGTFLYYQRQEINQMILFAVFLSSGPNTGLFCVILR